MAFDGYNSLESETNNLSKKKDKQSDFDTADVADYQIEKSDSNEALYRKERKFTDS